MISMSFLYWGIKISKWPQACRSKMAHENRNKAFYLYKLVCPFWKAWSTIQGLYINPCYEDNCLRPNSKKDKTSWDIMKKVKQVIIAETRSLPRASGTSVSLGTTEQIIWRTSPRGAQACHICCSYTSWVSWERNTSHPFEWPRYAFLAMTETYRQIMCLSRSLLWDDIF